METIARIHADLKPVHSARLFSAMFLENHPTFRYIPMNHAGKPMLVSFHQPKKNPFAAKTTDNPLVSNKIYSLVSC
jgi:hypothetical protein